ncbi:MAG: tetratricopeptide repeat protein [Planctomycetota bacterium]|nr:tetratricopeptide repeat protein [Planctomycetota bacterium]
MSLTIRTAFAACLWLTALVPPVLYAIHLGSPVAAIEIAGQVGTLLRWLLIGIGGIAILGMIIFPPFLPWLKLRLHRFKRRITTDPGPLLEAKQKLEHLETVPHHLLVGRILREQNQAAQSLPHFVRAIELEPGLIGARYELGITLSKLGHLEEAAEQLALVVREDEQHAFGAALLAFGLILERGDANEAAVQALERHEQLFGETRQGLYHRARARSRSGATEDAIALFQRAARPGDNETRLTAEDDLVRAQARVALWKGGKI